jgi:prepilin-type N-terminal cleavage/methylation domain-containing protein
MDRCIGRSFLAKERGMTFMELLVVIVLLLISATIAIPSFAQWRKNIESRQAARNIVQLLREARSRAIAMNKECRVEFEPAARRYGLRMGDKAADTIWTSVPPVSDWAQCPSEANFSSKVKSFQFNTNGTANGGTITVWNGNMQDMFDIIVNSTGRIRIVQKNEFAR